MSGTQESVEGESVITGDIYWNDLSEVELHPRSDTFISINDNLVVTDFRLENKVFDRIDEAMDEIDESDLSHGDKLGEYQMDTERIDVEVNLDPEVVGDSDV